MVRIVASDAETVIANVAARVATLASEADGPDAVAFVRRYYAGLDVDDLAGATVDELAGRALAHWRAARLRAPGTAIVRVIAPPHGHTIVDVVNDDMPFVVDSLTMALDRH